ncbi:helix-turn-helix transcriptional regulator [Candidatus Pacearchaeota archaeon]|nr:helix-turn-helix transcriptional regulator [Candidatus Pacearchaeota archaeon]
MTEKYLLFSLDDEKSKKLGEVISNPSCKKIMNLLAENEMSETEIANTLEMPINTAEYNIKKLVEAGLIEKAEHWWSVKGKKIPIYKLANKYIVISPKPSSKNALKTILPVAIISGIIALLIKYFSGNFNLRFAEKATDYLQAPSAVSESAGAVNAVHVSLLDKILSLPSWEWFAIGAGVAIVLFLILSWNKFKN